MCIQTVDGCDSPYLPLDLTINYSNAGTTSETACDTYSWDGAVLTQQVERIPTPTLMHQQVVILFIPLT